MSDSRLCNPPGSHIFLNGSWRCECGAIDYDAIAVVLAPELEEPIRMSLRVFDALIGEARG